MSDDKDKDKIQVELEEKAQNLADVAVPVDKTYSEIVEDNALKFIYEQYDEQQREEILATMERGRDGSIMWKGKDGDFVKLKYENGELIKGVLKDKDQNGEYEKIKFKVKDDGYVYKERSNYGVSIEKEKIKVKESKDKDEWLTVSKRESEKFGLNKFVEKAKVVLNDREEVVEAMSSSSSTIGSPFGVMYEKESKEFKVDGETGDVVSSKRKDDVLFNPIVGVIAQKEVEKKWEDEKGNSVSSKAKVSANLGLFGVGGGIEGERTIVDEQGNRETRGAGISGGIGYLGINGELSGKKEDVIVDSAGNVYEEGSSFEVGAGLGRKGIGGHFEAKERIKEIDGSERETSMKFETRVNLLGSGVRTQEEVTEKNESGVKRVDRERGIHISPLITENRVVDKTRGEVNGEEFESGVDVGVKNEKLKRAIRVAGGKADFRDNIEVISEGISVVSEEAAGLFEACKRFADRVDERSAIKARRGTVFDKTKENEELKKTTKEVRPEEIKSEIVAEPLIKEDDVELKTEETPLVKENNILEKKEKGVEPKMNTQDKKELKEDMKKQKDVQENVLKEIDEARDKEEKMEQIDRHFEPKRYEMQVIESINKFDTKVLDRENIRVKEKTKNKVYNEVLFKRLQETRGM